MLQVKQIIASVFSTFKMAHYKTDVYKTNELNGLYCIFCFLAGHTHGGQFFPASILIYLYNPFYAGLYEYRNSLVYVSQGAVYWGIPMRIGSEAEVNLITLYAEE